jgi:hypothetical protein
VDLAENWPADDSFAASGVISTGQQRQSRHWNPLREFADFRYGNGLLVGNHSQHFIAEEAGWGKHRLLREIAHIVLLGLVDIR